MREDKAEICPKCWKKLPEMCRTCPDCYGKNLPNLPKEMPIRTGQGLSKETSSGLVKDTLYCKKCGKKLDGDSVFCIYCGTKIRDKSITDYRGFPNEEHSRKPMTDKDLLEGETIEKEAGKWSWGAFGLGWIYLCSMEIKIWWLFLLVTAVINGAGRVTNNSTILIVIFGIDIIIRAFLGSFAKKWSLKSRKWESLKQYKKVQLIWNIWGSLAFVVFYAATLLSK